MALFNTDKLNFDSNTPENTQRGNFQWKDETQVEVVINWMNTWEQLKDTVIPIRFKEDFANNSFEFKGFDSKNYRFSPESKFLSHDCANHILEKNHLCWIYNRLINYGENPNVDYMHKLKEIALNFSIEKQFTLEDMRNCFDAGMKSCKFHLGYKHIDFENYIDSLKNPS